MEEWKTIDKTDNLLEVSNKGRIRSLMRDGRILKATPDKKGYLRIRVTIHRKKVSIKVHRVVAKAFIDNPKALPQVNHIDGNKQNNDANNLEWVSNYENAHHAMKTGLWGNVFKASQKSNEKRKTPIIATNVTTGERLWFESVSSAEQTIGTKHITDVLRGKRKQAKGFTFERG